jgi:hypothetical protein
VTKRLQAFLDEIGVRGQGRFGARPGGDQQGVVQGAQRNAGSSTGSPEGTERLPSAKPAPDRRLPFHVPGIPHVSFPEDPAILEEMSGRAAIYRHEEHAVLLNPDHFKYKDDLEKIYADAGPGADRLALAKRLFDEEYSCNAGKFIIQALQFKGLPQLDEKAWQEGVNPSALTVHLASPSSLVEARRRLRQKLNSRKIETQHG